MLYNELHYSIDFNNFYVTCQGQVVYTAPNEGVFSAEYSALSLSLDKRQSFCIPVN